MSARTTIATPTIATPTIATPTIATPTIATLRANSARFRLGRIRSGMTLIEILIALVIVASILGMATMMIGVLSHNALNGAARRMASTIELVYGRAALNGRRYRIVIDIDQQSYWAECSEENVALPEEAFEGETGEQDDTRRFERYDEDDEEADPFSMSLESMFDDCTEDLIPVRELPEGVLFDSVLTTHQEQPFLEGQATIAFFGNGFAERTIIWLRHDDEESEGGATLTIQPMTGHVVIENGLAEIPDDFFDIEEAR